MGTPKTKPDDRNDGHFSGQVGRIEASRSVIPSESAPAANGEFSVANGWEFVGIIDGDASGGRGRGPDGGTRLYIPLEYAESLHIMQASDLRNGDVATGGGVIYQSLVVRLKSPSRTASAEKRDQENGVQYFSAIDATSTLRQIFAVIDLFLGAFGSLALAVASIGIVNTLVMAITEERREIGIMKAVGASDTDIRKDFLAEAAVLGIAGGVTMGLKQISRVAHQFQGRHRTAGEAAFEEIWFVPLWLVGGALAFSLLRVCFRGAYPAGRAARLEPLEALRYE